MKTIAIDFDDTLVDKDGWILGAPDALNILLRGGYRIWIHSCRCNDDLGREHVTSTLLHHGFERWLRSGDLKLWFGVGKPMADLYLDDKALRFESWDDLLHQIRKYL